MHVLLVPEIATIICDYAVPDKVYLPGVYDLLRPSAPALKIFALVCKTWQCVALAHKSLIKSLWIRTLDDPHLHKIFRSTLADDLPVSPCHLDQISGQNTHRQHLTHIYLSLQWPYYTTPTVTWASQQDWLFSNLVSFRVKLSCEALSDATFTHLQQLIDHFQHLPTLQALCIEGDYERDAMEHSWENTLDISKVLKNRSINQLWSKGFQLFMNNPVATPLKKLALIQCQVTRESFVNLLDPNDGSLQFLHIEDIWGANLLWDSVSHVLLSALANITVLFFVQYRPEGVNELLSGVDILNILPASRTLKLLHSYRAPQVASLSERWPNLKVCITDDDYAHDFVKDALIQKSPGILCVYHPSFCTGCSGSPDAYYRDQWVPAYTATLHWRCRDCMSGTRVPWSEAAFYDQPFPSEMMPKNYDEAVPL